MLFIYNVLLIGWIILAGPIAAIKGFANGKRGPSFRERLGFTLKRSAPGTSTIWVHACSVGETQSVVALVKTILNRYPSYTVMFSTTTVTGQAVARERFLNNRNVNVIYFPIDLAWVQRRAFQLIKPVLILIVDTEIWPNFVQQAHLNNVPVLMINGRISPKSYPRYLRFRSFFRRVLAKYSLFLMTSESDADRIIAIGAPANKVKIEGNLKFDVAEHVVSDAQIAQIVESFGIDGNLRIWAAGSTHPGEETIILDAFEMVGRVPGLEDVKLLLAPRHPERAQSVCDEILERGLTVQRRSQPRIHPTSSVFLLDTVGELMSAYSLSDVAFVGGSLVQVGGHSILEPMAMGVPVVCGPYMQNSPGILEDFLADRSIIQITQSDSNKQSATELANAVIKLLSDPTICRSMASSAYHTLDRNRGVGDRFIDQISQIRPW